MDSKQLQEFFKQILDATRLSGTTVKIVVSDFGTETAIEASYCGDDLWHVVEVGTGFEGIANEVTSS